MIVISVTVVVDVSSSIEVVGGVVSRGSISVLLTVDVSIFAEVVV